MNLAAIDRRLVQQGSDLEREDRYSLINEGYVRLAVESEWTRRSVVLEPVGDGRFVLPADCARVLGVRVGGVPVGQVDPDAAARVELNQLGTFGRPVWWLEHDSAGGEVLRVFPAPGPDVHVQVSMVFRPGELVNPEDVPVLPVEFHGEIINSALAFAYGVVGDDPDLMELYRGRHEDAVTRLRVARRKRKGSGPIRARIVGVDV